MRKLLENYIGFWTLIMAMFQNSLLVLKIYSARKLQIFSAGSEFYKASIKSRFLLHAI